MTRRTSITVLSALALALPAGPAAAAGTSHAASASRALTATVLDASARSHQIRVVTSRRAVRTLRITGHLGRGVARGARIRFTVAGNRAEHVKVLSRALSVSFYARVARSSRGALVVTAGDGRRLSLAAPKTKLAGRHPRRKGTVRAHIASDIPVTIQGLKPGQVVLVTIDFSPNGGELSITITIVDTATAGTTPSSAPGTPATGQMSGTVVAADEDTGVFTVLDASGDTTDFTLTPALLAASDALPNECDLVTVAYHQDPSTPDVMLADAITTTGADATSAECSDSSADQEAVGVVAAVDPVSGAITVTTSDGRPLLLAADPSLLDGINPGAAVDVLYAQADDGTLVVDDLAPVDATGSD